jgi:hypothetical protein
MDYKCTNCGYEGPCYGLPHSTGLGRSAGVSAPICAECGRNHKLVPLNTTNPRRKFKKRINMKTLIDLVKSFLKATLPLESNKEEVVS